MLFSCKLHYVLRFNEWGRAIAAKQIEELKAYHSGASHQCWRFLGISHPEDMDVSALAKHVAGLLMQACGNRKAVSSLGVKDVVSCDSAQGWWDDAPEAGPKTRPAEPLGIPTPMLEVLSWDGSQELAHLGRS